MARQILPQSRYQGISYSEKEGRRSSFLFAKHADYRSDPTKLTILPRTTKISGSVIIDLILDGDQDDVYIDTYLYGDAGNIYKRTSADVVTNIHTVPSSSGKLGSWASELIGEFDNKKGRANVPTNLLNLFCVFIYFPPKGYLKNLSKSLYFLLTNPLYERIRNRKGN